MKTEGRLVSVNKNEILIEEQRGKGKKVELVQLTIPFENIKATKIQIKF
jgi:ribosome maturation factor RimP